MTGSSEPGVSSNGKTTFDVRVSHLIARQQLGQLYFAKISRLYEDMQERSAKDLKGNNLATSFLSKIYPGR